MAFSAIKCLLILLVIFAFEEHLFSQAAGTSTANPIKKTTTKPTNTTHTTSGTLNGTGDGDSGEGSTGISFPNNKGLLKRMLYVAVACSALIAVYFIVKTIRTKSRKSKSKKYGMIFSSGDVEMQPLDNDDDDDDMTVFDRKIRK